MRRVFLILLALSVYPASLRCAPDTSTQAPLTAEQYSSELDELRSAVQQLKDDPTQIDPVLQRIPQDVWHVNDGGRDLQVPSAGLRSNLQEWQKKQDPALLDGVITQLDARIADLRAYRGGTQDVSTQRTVLNTILARREFSSVHGPTWLDRLKQRINEFLFRLLGKAISSSVIPEIGDVVVYGLILIAVLGVAYWMYRSLRDSTKLETIMPVPVGVSAKEWPVWLREARAAGARGDWREAVHLAYWGGISFLEAQGAWRADRARTPREYLQLVQEHPERRTALRALTQRLESVWYGMSQADPAAFDQTLVDLQKLGCPCN